MATVTVEVIIVAAGALALLWRCKRVVVSFQVAMRLGVELSLERGKLLRHAKEASNLHTQDDPNDICQDSYIESIIIDKALLQNECVKGKNPSKSQVYRNFVTVLCILQDPTDQQLFLHFELQPKCWWQISNYCYYSWINTKISSIRIILKRVSLLLILEVVNLTLAQRAALISKMNGS